MISRRIGSGIGLAREAFAHHRGSQEPLPQPEELTPSAAAEHQETAAETDDIDKAAWQLDDIQEQFETSLPFVDAQNEEQLIAEFNRRYPPPPEYIEKEGQLPYPVCLPQRRPRHRTRGFVRAYAPVLEETGITQDMFLDFLAGFEKAIELHQVFNAVQVVIRGTDLALQIACGPNLALHAATWCIHAGIEVGRRRYVRYRTNKYLDDMNLHLFRPRGLYALIMCYKPLDNRPEESSDSINKAISHRSDGDGPKTSAASGTTRSELELPEAATLIFPELDAAVMEEDKKPNVAKRANDFLGDYYDRRAQARFEYDNPNSKLNVGAPRKQFVSRYSDPTSPAVNAGLLGLVTCGRVKGVRYRIQQHRREKRIAEGKSGANRRLLTEDVYYLLIVNYPSEEEIQEAKRQLLEEEGALRNEVRQDLKTC